MKPVKDVYREELISKHGIEASELDNLDIMIKKELEEAFVRSKSTHFSAEDWMTADWESI
jgi:2-oxoglutarate dehydrogenase complex dehydrogenase (E1) component-like enzyme